MHLKCDANFTRQRKDVPSTLPDMWQRAQNADLCLTKTASLQRTRLFSRAKAAPSQQSESRVFTLQTASLQESRFFSKLIDASSLRVRTASLEQHDPCVYKTYIQSLLLQISSTVHWHKQTTVHPWFKVHQQPAQSTEEVQTAYLDTHHDHLWRLQRIFIVHS